MKYALVTGANRGIGQGFVQVLIKKGYTVYAAARDIATFPYAHERVHPIAMHIDDDASIRRAFEALATDGVRIDLLINNAGVSKRSKSVGGSERVCELTQLDRAALLHMFSVNAVGPLMVMRYCLPLMTAKHCFVINVSSGRSSFDNDSPNANYGYRASKLALNMFTKASILDLPPTVQTFAVHPGLVRTEMHPDGETLPTEAAAQVLAILDHWNPAKNGAFLNADGSIFPLETVGSAT